MKHYLLFALMAFSAITFAKDIISSDQNAMVHAARVVDVIDLGREGDVQIKATITDLGGSTDLSPTQKIYFTLYRKSEMFSTDAAFDLGHYFSFTSAKPLKDRRFALEVKRICAQSSKIVIEEFIINAHEAITEIQKINCNGEFDCKASAHFKTKISIE